MNSEIDISKKEFTNPFYAAVHERIYKRNQNTLILIVGSPGTGKSLLALRLAEQLDPTFTHENVRDRVVVKADQFSKLIANEDDSKLQKGAVFIVDEMGASVGNRSWYSVGNRMVSIILQTFRYRQLIMIMTVPNMSFIDVSARKLVDFLIETKKVDFNKNRTKARVWRLVFNKVSGDSEPYRQRFRTKDEYDETVIIDHMWFGRCDIKLANRYEKYSYEFKQTMAETALSNIIKAQTKEKKKASFNMDKIVAHIVANRIDYIKHYNGREMLNKSKIENEFGVGARRSSQIMEKVNSTPSREDFVKIK